MTITATRTRRLAGITAFGAISALTLSACGSSVPTIEEVWPDVRENLVNAESVKVSGEITQDGQDMNVDMSGHVDDSSYSGNIAMGEYTIEVLGNADNTYVKANEAFWEANGGAQLLSLIGDKWLEAPAEEMGFTMSSFYDSFSSEAPEASEFEGKEFTAEEVEHNGEQVYKYTGTEDESGDPVSYFINKENQLVRMERPESTEGSSDAASDDASGDASASPSASSGAGAGAIDFTEWNAVEPVEMPAEDEVFAIPGM